MGTGLDDLLERSAVPAAARLALTRLEVAHPGLTERAETDIVLGEAVVAVASASRSLTLVLETDPVAIDVLADLDRPAELDRSSPERLVASKRRELARIAARDLLGRDDLEATTAAVSALAAGVLGGACELAGAENLSVIGMGKLGAGELNYASDVDILFATTADPEDLLRRARRVMDLTRPAFRVDANLRPEGRDGALVRTVASYDAYWRRWADAWEFQALLKSRPVAGDPDAGEAFAVAAAEALWSRPFSAEDLRAVRALKERTEAEIVKRGLAGREIKRGPGGIRDIEFSLQLLQLVHGRLDPDLRAPSTLAALAEMGAAGYVDPTDAGTLAQAYRFLRAVEHRLQLVEEQPTYAVPEDPAERERLARVMGYRDGADASARDRFDADLARWQARVRSIHERLYFRPLLEAFAGTHDRLAWEGDPSAPRPEGVMSPEAVEARLAAFGFAQARRTEAAVRELTRGLTRASRMMQQLLPLMLGWLSETPDPDLGLLGLRNLATGTQRSTVLIEAFRDSPEAGRSLCRLLGTSRLVGDLLRQNPDLVERLPDPTRLRTLARDELIASAERGLGWRTDPDERQAALRRWHDRHWVGICARDVQGMSSVLEVERDLTAVAEAVLELAVATVDPQVRFAVVALGRFAGAELSYASDLDVIFVYDGSTPSEFEAAERAATRLRRFVGGTTPAGRIYEVDLDLRPEGKSGPLARSVEGYRSYFARWAQVWERQALSRARPVAGDLALGQTLIDVLAGEIWEAPFTGEHEREVRRMKARIERERMPRGEDPDFHLKLGRGSLSDIEFTVQLLQLRHHLREPGTVPALEALAAAGHLDDTDCAVLREAYTFCERTRNRLFLVNSGPADSLPTAGDDLTRLAVALDTSGPQLREDYRRVTRRARRVVERLFYARD